MSASPNKARDIFVAAVKLAPEQWDAHLAEVCGGDEALRDRVRNLLAAHQEAGSFLEPAAGLAVTTDEPVAERPGAVIGPYKLLEQIGEGGFGVVFMAEQTQPVRRKVALKVLKPGMDTRQVVARFEAERQALAIMDHPNIAKVFDGGATPNGRPYFVMELVRGVPITNFCDQSHLTPRQRLELFISVCQAVQHAHQKGIIHRDIKPTNVLVTVHDMTPAVKVIDFGVAKALGQELTDETLFTGFAQMIGTPLYMSPEQAGQSGLDVDTRSDVYSLGVLLYELLTGTTPFDRERFKRAAYDEIRRIIREEEPPRPSTRLSGSKDALPSITAQRRTELAELTKLVRGELDWVVMRCLEKDRTRRYETASSLARDVERYLKDEPVEAYPPSAWYRFRKFARRNKRNLAVVVLLGATLAVVMGTLAASNVAIRQEQQQTANALRAETEAREELLKVHERERRDLYDLRLALARQEWLAGNLDQAKAHLAQCPPELRDQDWRGLQRSCQAEALRINENLFYVIFSPDRQSLVTSGPYGRIAIRDATTGQVRATFGSDSWWLETFAVSGNGKQLLCVMHRHSLVPVSKLPATPTIRVTVVELASGKEIGGFTRIDRSKRAAISPDGRSVALGSGFPQPVTIYDALTGQELGRLNGGANYNDHLAFLPDGRGFVTVGGEKVTRFSDAVGTEPPRTIDLKMPKLSYRGALALSADGRWFAKGGVGADRSPVQVKVWDLLSGQEITTLPAQKGAVTALAFRPDGRWLALGSTDSTITVWDVKTGSQAFVLRGHTAKVRGLAFSADGCRLASASDDNTVRIWDTQLFD